MGAPAPKPINLRAMAAVWDDPVSFARELARYYNQLETSGHRLRAQDWTTSRERPSMINTPPEVGSPGLYDPIGLERVAPGLYAPGDAKPAEPGLYELPEEPT